MKRIWLLNFILLFVFGGSIWALSYQWVQANKIVSPLGINAPVDCNTAVPPVIAYEISRAQSTDSVIAFLTNLTTQGYTVGTVNIVTEGSVPACVDVLIVHGLSGTVALSSPYTAAEGTLLKNWVTNGHGLMINGDWSQYKDETQALFAAFGYYQEGTFVRDPTDHDPQGPVNFLDSWVIYQNDNFADQPIFAGVASLQLQTGSWLSPIDNSIVQTDADAVPSQVSVMAAFVEGTGCVFLSSDSNWYATDDGIGAYAKQNNAQVASQLVGWLNDCRRLTLSKTASSNSVLPGEQITYTLTAVNNSNFNVTNLLIQDTLPAQTQFVSASQPYTGPDADGTITWAHNSLAVGASYTATLVVTVDDTLDQEMTIANWAELSTAENITDTAVAHTSLHIPAMQTKLFLPILMHEVCIVEQNLVDVILVVDVSGSMNSPIPPGTTTRLDAAKEAGITFLNAMTFPGDQAGIVSFGDQAHLVHALDDNRQSLITAMQSLTIQGATRIDLGLIAARMELTGTNHINDHDQVLILLTDGYPSQVNEATVLAEASTTKASGIIIYTIGLGNDTNANLLRKMATAPDHYYESPSTTELNTIYQEITNLLHCT